MGILANENAIGGGNYLIERSLRFQSASSQYLARTPAGSGNTQKWTWSCWVKRGSIGVTQSIFMAGNATADYTILYFTSDTLAYQEVGGSVNQGQIQSNAVYRDPSAWYHIVATLDSANATAADRIILYVNGSRVTVTTTANLPLNDNSVMNTGGQLINIGKQSAGTANYFDGYMAEVNFIDGQALTPSSFGETDALTGVWVAKRYTGTYGTNGFYLKFNDGTSTTTLGQDRSGNANNWTLTNFTRSAGVSDCWMLDVPSGNGSPSATQPSSNYAVLNPLDNIQASVAVTAGNLNISTTVAAQFGARATIGASSGKFYWEVTAGNQYALIGIDSLITPITTNNWPGSTTTSYSYYGNSGQKYNNNSSVAYGATFTTNDVIGIALDLDNGKLYFSKNNVWQNSGDPVAGTNAAFTGISGTFTAAIGDADGVTVSTSANFNFGQRSFAYTPPSGFKALCTANLPTPTIGASPTTQANKYFDATLWTGNQTTPRTITNTAGFSPDLVWIKTRSVAYDHTLYDTVRGAGNNKALYSNTTNTEGVGNEAFYGYLSAFESNGFTVAQGTGGSGAAPNGYALVNQNSTTYVAWQWDAGSSTVTNTSGSISSQVRANTTAGFSIVTYTGTGANATVGHGLGVAPKMVIVKNRNDTNVWVVYHASLTSASYFLQLASTAAQTSNATVWNSTAPTSSVFSIGTNGATNQSASQTYVAYCFAEIAGFSKFGSYTGNGSADGPFVFTNFKPKFIMIKRTDTAGFNWLIFDSARNSYNTNDKYLNPNTADAETSGFDKFDFLSNGFKARIADRAMNTNGATYIYAAFAESPFSSSNAA